MSSLSKENLSVYFRNNVVPFITASLLALASTNMVVLVSGGSLGFGTQLITTVIPVVLWFYMISSAHLWTLGLPPKNRAKVSSLQALIVFTTWSVFTVVGGSMFTPVLLLLQAIALLSVVVASFLNAYFINKETAMVEKETTVDEGNMKRVIKSVDKKTAATVEEPVSDVKVEEPVKKPAKKPVKKPTETGSSKKPTTTDVSKKSTPSKTTSSKPASSSKKPAK